jgi:hypothetical protein
MPCIVCKHTIKNVGVPYAGVPLQRVFWCPRCWSLEELHGEVSKFSEPTRLVEFVRAANDCARVQSGDGQTLGVLIPVNVWRDICEAVGVEMPK